MTRRRLGVVLLIPEPAASEVRGLRRALGSPSLDSQPPHLTLVPPVNVTESRVDDAVAVLRRAAALIPPALSVRLGPARTFSPVSPVVYLGIDGDLVVLSRLQQAVFAGPLLRRVDYSYVPHVTLHESADDDLIAASTRAFSAFDLDIALSSVHLLEQGPDRVWRPFADVRFGPVVVRGRGGIELHLRWTVMGAPDAARLWESVGLADSDGPWLEGRDGFDVLVGVRRAQHVVVITERLGEGIEDRLLVEPAPD